MDEITRQYYGRACGNSITNCYQLMDSAKLLFDDGKRGHALFLLHIAYEEISKGVYCNLVSAGFLNPDEIEDVFKFHAPKAVLFDKLFIEVHSTQFRLRNQRIDRAMLMNLPKNNDIKEYQAFKNRCLYIDKGNDLWLPNMMSADTVEKKRQELQFKISALYGLINILTTEQERLSTIDNFIVEWRTNENGDPLVSIQYDTT